VLDLAHFLHREGDLIASMRAALVSMLVFSCRIGVDDPATFIENYRSHKQKKQNLSFS